MKRIEQYTAKGLLIKEEFYGKFCTDIGLRKILGLEKDFFVPSDKKEYLSMKRRKTGWGFGVFLVIAFLVCGLISLYAD